MLSLVIKTMDRVKMENIHDTDQDLFYILPSIDSLHEEIIEEQPEFEETSEQRDFHENLAETLPENILNKISGQLIDAIDDDILSRKDWEIGLKDALEQCGLQVEKMEFPFPRACGVYSQIMMQSIMEFYSSAVAELLPLEGPTKELIIGEPTEELEEQAKRVEQFGNYFFTQMAPEFYPDFKKMLPWVGLAGHAIRKVYFDPILRRPTSKFFKAQDFIVSYGTTSLTTCWRMTEVLRMNAADLQRYKDMGIYRHVKISPQDESDEQSDFEMTVDRTEGVRRPAYDLATDFELYECHTYLDINDLGDNYNGMDSNDDAPSYRPYRITMHKETFQVLAVYRNWKEDDEEFKRKDYYVDYGFADGFGFYKLGAAHLIGGIATACTTLLRQYIDGMTLSNFPGGMHIKGMRLEDNNIRIGPTEFIPVDTGGLPIQDAIMLMPYKEPSPGINEMRKELEMAAARIMGAANAQMGEFNPNAPVGTTLALLDVINLNQSTVMRSLRDSMATEIKLFYTLFSETLPEEEISFDTAGASSVIKASDFSTNIRLVPLADPHVTTKMQRLMRAQTLYEMALGNPGVFDVREAALNYIKEVKISDSLAKKLVPDKEDIKKLDPVTENMNLMQSMAVKAYIDQDHAAHKIVHESLLQNPQMDPNVAAAVTAHIAQHSAFEFQIQMQQGMGMEIPEKPEEVPEEIQNKIAMMAAQVVQQQMQQQQEQLPPPPLDPAAVMLEEVKVKAAALEQKAKSDELKAQTEAFKAQLANEAKMKELEIKLIEIESRMRETELNVQAKAFDAQLTYDAKMKEPPVTSPIDIVE